MLHDTVTVTRTKALVTAPTALAIAQSISHERRIRPHYSIPDRNADQIICDVLDEHYDAAGGVPLREPDPLFNHRDLLDFEQHCASTAALFAVDIWQFNYAGLVHIAISMCSRAGIRDGTLDKYSENHVYFYGSAKPTRFTASSRPDTTDLDTLLFEDSNVVAGHVTGRVATDALDREVEVHTVSGPDITASDWNLPLAGTDFGFDAVWPDGVVRGVYEFHRSN